MYYKFHVNTSEFDLKQYGVPSAQALSMRMRTHGQRKTIRSVGLSVNLTLCKYYAPIVMFTLEFACSLHSSLVWNSKVGRLTRLIGTIDSKRQPRYIL